MTSHLREQDYIPYLDGKLRGGERERVDAHLAACPDCRTRVEEMRALSGVLDQWTAVEPSPAFDAALRTRLATEKEKVQPWFILRPAYALGALAALVALAVVFGLWQTSTQPEARQVVEQTGTPEVTQPEAGTPSQVESLPELTTVTAGSELAVLEDAVLLENYELLQEFDVLFEGPDQEGEESL